jgi:hypothetical protein
MLQHLIYFFLLIIQFDDTLLNGENHVFIFTGRHPFFTSKETIPLFS